MKFKKLFTWLIAALLLTAVGNANAANYDYWAEVYTIDSAKSVGNMDKTRVTGANVTFQVLTVDSDTEATLTQIGSSTSLTNPVTTANFDSSSVCNDRVAFRTTASTVDLLVNHTNGGFSVFIEDFSPEMHTIVIDETKGIRHHAMIWFSVSSTTSIDTGIDFLPDTFIHDVIVEAVTTDDGETLSVGTADDSDGFRNLVLLTTAGYVKDTAVITAGTSVDYYPVSTYGALLYTLITGADSDGQEGGKSFVGHVVETSGNNDDLYYSASTSDAVGAGYIHYWLTRMR